MSESVWKFMKENKLQFESDIKNELKCNICNELMIKACSAPCGCRFCSDCIEHYLDGNDKLCPGTSKYCRKNMLNCVNEIVIDYPSNIRISEIVVTCPRQNCLFKDELDIVANHFGKCDKRSISCPFNAVGCEKNEVMGEEMKTHLNEENYSHSKLLLEMINNLLGEIESMKNEIIELKKENSQFKQQFAYIELQSANQQQKICEMESKEIDNSKEIEELNEEMVALKNENRLMRIEFVKKDELNNEIKGKTELIQTKSQKEIDELKRNYEQQHQELNIELKMLRGEIDKISDEGAKGASRVDTDHGETCKQIFDRKINVLEMKIIELETKLEISESVWHHNWLIANVSKQKRGKWIYSESFYSGPSEYKMCLSAIMDCADTLYVYFHMMSGEYDDKLAWPFKYIVTIDVINTGNRDICRSKTIKYSECQLHAGWRKPSNDRSDAIWFLNIRMPPALKNDQLLIKCRVESECKVTK